jgi:hypothetical protein
MSPDRLRSPEHISVKSALAVSSLYSEMSVMYFIPLRHSCAVCIVFCKVKAKSKVIPATGRGGLYGCVMSRITHCLHNRPIDGREVVSLTRRPHCTPQKHLMALISVRV